MTDVNRTYKTTWWTWRVVSGRARQGPQVGAGLWGWPWGWRSSVEGGHWWTFLNLFSTPEPLFTLRCQHR
jgi:hypothetical protein